MDEERIQQSEPAIGDEAGLEGTTDQAGAEPMSGQQSSYLGALSDQSAEEFDENITKEEASKRIEDLQAKQR